jgi:hypothetical protein
MVLVTEVETLRNDLRFPALAIMPIDRRSCSYENGVVGWADVVSLWRLEPVTSLTREPRALCSVAMSTYLSFF